ELEAAFDAGIIGRARRLLDLESAELVDVARAEEFVLRVSRLAAELGAYRVIVHEGRRRPNVYERDVAVVTAATVLEFVAFRKVCNDATLMHRLRAILMIEMPGHVIGMQRAAVKRAHFGRRRRLIVAEEVGSWLARVRVAHRVIIAARERSAGRFRDARVA